MADLIRARVNPAVPKIRARILPSLQPLQVEFQEGVTHIQWRYVGQDWQDLIAIADLIGPAGAAGTNGSDGADGADGIMASVVAGTGIQVDATDPANPIVAVSANLQEYDAVNPTAAGLALLDDADAAAQLTTLGFSAFIQTLIDDANAAAALTTLGLTANGQSLVTAANYAAMRALLDLEAGTDFYSIAAANAAFQPLDADLTTIAGLAATTDNFLQSKSSAWASRTPTQVTADLAAMVGDSGSGGTKGLVPAPAAGDAAAGKFLKADGTFAVPAGGAGLTIDSQQPTSTTNAVTSTGFSSCNVVTVWFAFTNSTNAPTYSLQARVSGGTWRTLYSFSGLADNTSAVAGYFTIANFGVATEKLVQYRGYTEATVIDSSSAIKNLTTDAANGFAFVAYDEIWDEVRISSTASSIEGTTSDERGRWYAAGYS